MGLVTQPNIHTAPNFMTQYVSIIASFPGSPVPRTYTGGRAWYRFSHDHDVINIGPESLEQKGNILRVIQPTLRCFPVPEPSGTLTHN